MSDFISTWNTANTSVGSSNADQVKLPLSSVGTYNFTVNWGDGNEDVITAYDQAEVIHTYASSGNYTVTISGTIISFQFNDTGDKLKITDISQWGILNVGNNGGYFYGCSNLDVSAADSLDITGITTFSTAFRNCSNLTTLDVSGWNTSNVTSFSTVFRDCSNLTTLDVSGWNTSNVTSFSTAFYNCSNLATLDVSGWNTSNVTSFSTAFYNCSSLTTLDVSGWNTSNVTTFYYAFYNCSNLTTLDVSGWDTSNVTTFYYAFYNCSNLTTLDVSGWDTSNVTTFYYAFRDCSNLTTLDVSGWNTSNVTSFSTAFRDCSNLTTLDVSGWNTSNVTSFSTAFYNCSSLTTLDVSGWDTSNVTTFYYAFYNCSNLTTLDVSGWDVSLVTSMVNMLTNVTLTTVSYNTLLNSWAITLLQNAVIFDGGNSKYSYEAIDARKYMISQYGWTISDGGQSDDIQPAWFMNWIAQSYTAERNYSHDLDNVIDSSDTLLAIGNTKESTTELTDLSSNGNNGTINGCMPTDGFFMSRRFVSDNSNSLFIGATSDDLYNVADITCIVIIKPIPDGDFYQCIFDFSYPGTTPNNVGYGPMTLSSNQIDFRVQNGTLGEGGQCTSNATIVSDKYHIIHAQYDGINLQIYVDGILHNTVVWNESISSALGKSTGYIGAKYNNADRHFQGGIGFILFLNKILTESERNKFVNTIAALPFWSINYQDYPDNATQYTDRLPYSTTIISAGTFKVDADALNCVSAGTITYRAAHEFDGSELIVVNKGLATEFSGTGSATSGNTTVSVAQGSNKITCVLGTGDTVDSIDIQFREEV